MNKLVITERIKQHLFNGYKESSVNHILSRVQKVHIDNSIKRTYNKQKNEGDRL